MRRGWRQSKKRGKDRGREVEDNKKGRTKIQGKYRLLRF